MAGQSSSSPGALPLVPRAQYRRGAHEEPLTHVLKGPSGHGIQEWRGRSTGVRCLKDLPGEERWVWSPAGRTHVGKVSYKTYPGHTGLSPGHACYCWVQCPDGCLQEDIGGLCLELSAFPRQPENSSWKSIPGKEPPQLCQSSSASEPFVSDSGNAPTIKPLSTY